MSSDPKWSDLASGDSARVIAAANGLLPFWVSALLVVLIAWQLAKVAWLFVPGTSAGDPVSIPATEFSQGPSSSAINVQAIADASLFGKADPEDEPVAALPELVEGPDLEDTSINLVLKGTIASNEDESSAAIISIGTSDEKVYQIGDAVASGASLHAVYTDRVVLNENGRLTALRLPEEFSEAAPRAQTRRTTSSVNRSRNSSQQRSIQSVVSNNVARLSDVIRPTPYFVNGQQQGYRVYPGRDRRQFAALGLRPGDLIKDIDGQALSDPAQAMQIFQSLGTANQVSVTVERDGKPETITLKTDQLDLGGQESGNEDD